MINTVSWSSDKKLESELTIGAGIVRRPVDGAIGKELKMSILVHVHLDFSRGAGDVRQVGTSFAPGRGILDMGMRR